MTTPNPSLRDVLQQAGFTGQGLETALGVAIAESGGRPMAHNGNAGTGDNSYGLFQINMLGKLGPARLEQYGLSSNEDLYDPLTNAKVAFKMSDGGTNFQPWTTYTRGTYEQYVGQDRPLGGDGSLGAAGGDFGSGGDDTGSTGTLAPATTTGSGYDIGSGTPLSSLMPSTQQSAAQIAYLTGQDPVPVATGSALGADASGLPGKGAPEGAADHFVAAAVAQAGDHYVVGARGTGQADPTQFDCSGLVQWSAHQVGVALPNTSYEQFLQLKAEGALIPVDQAIHTPGALLFHFSEQPTPGGSPPDERHVAISLGNGRTIEAENPEDGVREDNAGHRFEYAAIVPGIGAGTTPGGPSTLTAGATPLLDDGTPDHHDWSDLSTDHTSPLAELMGPSDGTSLSDLMGDDPGHPGLDLGH